MSFYVQCMCTVLITVCGFRGQERIGQPKENIFQLMKNDRAVLQNKGCRDRT